MKPSKWIAKHLDGHEHQSTSEALIAYLDSRWEQEQDDLPAPMAGNASENPSSALANRLRYLRDRLGDYPGDRELSLLNEAITAVEERDEALRRLREVYPTGDNLHDLIDAALLAATERARRSQPRDWDALLACGDAITEEDGNLVCDGKSISLAVRVARSVAWNRGVINDKEHEGFVQLERYLKSKA